MEEEEHTDRNQQLAKLYQKINIIKKKYLYEGKTGPVKPLLHVNTYVGLKTLLFQMTQTT